MTGEACLNAPAVLACGLARSVCDARMEMAMMQRFLCALVWLVVGAAGLARAQAPADARRPALDGHRLWLQVGFSPVVVARNEPHSDTSRMRLRAFTVGAAYWSQINRRAGLRASLDFGV